ncbi:MAG: hypothetical protein K8S56_10335 [Candidatus Cloacimonetes bacterium]|nr:hypothetical protein [Candidatus Cloacimonadota bacterium]
MEMSKSTNWLTLITLILLFSFSANLAAQDDALLNKQIPLDVEDGDIAHVISTMAKFSGANIVLAIDTAVEDKQGKYEGKKITVHLQDVPIEQALSLVVKTVGLSYRLIGDRTFLVGEKDKIEEEVGERSYILNLNYVDSEMIEEALSIMPGKIKPVEGSNALIVMANPETFSEISKRVQELDVPIKQIEIRARLIEVNITDSKKMGIDWSRLNRLTTIMAEDPEGDFGQGLPYQYLGTDSNLSHGSLIDFATLPEAQYFQKMDEMSNQFHFSRQLYAFDITIDWLLQNNAAKLLTDTRITAMNDQIADIHIGEIVPFVVLDRDHEIQVEREEVGIKLKVQPKVNADGQITTMIAPEVSSVVELVGGYIPRTKTRKINTTVTVPSGSKIIVGGLLTTQKVVTKNKFPFLGDIPFIGEYLFTHTFEEIATTDLIIEITPRIVDVAAEQVEFDIDPDLQHQLINKK